MSFHKRAYSLRYAVRPAVTLKYLGQLLLAVAMASLVPFTVSAAFGEYASTLRYGIVVVGLALPGVLLARRVARARLQTNEALVITALVFLLTPLAMAFPMMGHGLSFLDALFETVSAVTTTGLTALETVSDRSDAFLFSRAWMQWYGGLGIVVLSVALLIAPGAAARRLARTGAEWEDPVAGTRLHARRVASVYLVLTIAGVLGLWSLGVQPYAALLHALAGISTGGFSTHDNSMAGLGSWSVQAALMALSFAGALSLALYHPAYLRNWRDLAGHLELRGLLVAAVLVSLALGLCLGLVGSAPWPEVLRHAPLVAVSAQTGTGFTSMPIGELDAASKLVLIVSMVIGGGVGSTAGGIKILRLLILLRLLQLLVQRACMPSHAVLEPRLGGHRLVDREIEHALLIILLFVIVIVVSWLPFLAWGYEPLDALFEVVSATATVGLSTGVTGPDLPAFLKAVLCLDMLLGRLEVVALVLVLYPGTWFGKRTD